MILSRTKRSSNKRFTGSRGTATIPVAPASGKVILCCADWREEVVFGDVTRQGLMEIWRSPEFRRYRELQARRTIDDLRLCNTCTYQRRRVKTTAASAEPVLEPMTAG